MFIEEQPRLGWLPHLRLLDGTGDTLKTPIKPFDCWVNVGIRAGAETAEDRIHRQAPVALFEAGLNLCAT